MRGSTRWGVCGPPTGVSGSARLLCARTPDGMYGLSEWGARPACRRGGYTGPPMGGMRVSWLGAWAPIQGGVRVAHDGGEWGPRGVVCSPHRASSHFPDEGTWATTTGVRGPSDAGVCTPRPPSKGTSMTISVSITDIPLAKREVDASRVNAECYMPVPPHACAVLQPTLHSQSCVFACLCVCVWLRVSDCVCGVVVRWCVVCPSLPLRLLQM